MSKGDIIKGISKETGVSSSTVSMVVDLFLKSIADNLKAEGKVAFKEIGKFSVKHREAREARNPRTGEKIEVAAKNVVTFSPSTALSESVN